MHPYDFKYYFANKNIFKSIFILIFSSPFLYPQSSSVIIQAEKQVFNGFRIIFALTAARNKPHPRVFESNVCSQALPVLSLQRG